MPALRILFGLIFTVFMAFSAHGQSFDTKAPYAVIMDGESGIVLFEKNAREPIGPSSMTKIMTAEIVFSRLKDGSLSFDTEFPVSEKAWRKQGSKMFVRVDDMIRVEDLLRGIIIQSGNDACIVVAEGISGSEEQFAQLMTARAQQLGLTTANFKNASGWPEAGHVISVYDLARLARHIIYEYPDFFPLYSETEFTWSDIRQPNRNPILGRVAGADGMKTGHTEDNGYGFVGTAERDGRRVIIVVNGLTSEEERRRESARLINAGFQQFEIIEPFSTTETIINVPVWVGKANTVPLVPTEPVVIGVSKSDRQSTRFKAEFDTPVIAPIAKGQVLGELIIAVPGQAEQRVPLVAAQSVERKGLIGRILSGFGPGSMAGEWETKE